MEILQLKTCGPFGGIFIYWSESVMVLVVLADLVFMVCFQLLQHLQHCGLETSAQVLAAVGFS